MEGFKRNLIRMRWKWLCKDMVSVIGWSLAIPAVILFWGQNFGGLQVTSETVGLFYNSLFVLVGPIAVIIYFLMLRKRKRRIGCMYLAPEERKLCSYRGIQLYDVLNSRGKYVYKIRIENQRVENFIIGFLTRYDLLGETESITSKYEHRTLENWAQEYTEWVLERPQTK